MYSILQALLQFDRTQSALERLHLFIFLFFYFFYLLNIYLYWKNFSYNSGFAQAAKDMVKIGFMLPVNSTKWPCRSSNLRVEGHQVGCWATLAASSNSLWLDCLWYREVI